MFYRIVKKNEENENTSMSGAAARTGRLHKKKYENTVIIKERGCFIKKQKQHKRLEKDQLI